MKDKLAALLAAQADSEPEDEYYFPEADPMEAFFSEIQTIQETIDRIEACVQEVKDLHSTLITAPRPDPKDTQRLEDLAAEIKQAANKTRFKLKQIEPEDATKADNLSRIKVTQHMSLTKKMVAVMTEYNTAQVDYSDRCKVRLQRQLEIAGKQVTAEDIEDILEKGQVSVFIPDIITETKQEKQRVADIEARHADLVKLERSIKELHDMFMDMAMLVENQGELIDRIEYLVDSTVDNVAEGTEELRKAQRAQDKARKKKIMIVLCLIISGVIVISIIAAIFS